jgi:hypothetical protein
MDAEGAEKTRRINLRRPFHGQQPLIVWALFLRVWIRRQSELSRAQPLAAK